MSGDMQVLLFDDVTGCNPHESTMNSTLPPYAYTETTLASQQQQQHQQQQPQQQWLMTRPMLSMEQPQQQQQQHLPPPSLLAPPTVSLSADSSSLPLYKTSLCRSSSPTSASQVVPRSPASTSSEDSSDTIDLSKLSKAELRKHKNRESAARSRKRSRERMQYLETLVRDLRAKNRHLEQTVQMLTAQQRMQWTMGPTNAPPPPPNNMQTGVGEYHRSMPSAPMMGMAAYYDPSLMQH